MSAEGIGAVLHLGTMAVALTAGYLGLDRVRPEEADNFRKGLDAARARVEQLLMRLELKRDGRAELKPMFNVYQVHILCHVARVEVPLGCFWRAWHVCQRQFYVPMLGYFRHRTDRIVVGTLAVLSTLWLMLLSCGLVWHFPIAEDEIVIKASWVAFTATIIWIFVTAGVSYRLQRIGAVCERLDAEISKRVIEFKEDVMGTLNHLAPQAADAPPANQDANR